MLNTMLIILVISSLLNIVADILLLWGIKDTNWEPTVESIKKTPTSFLLIGSLSGLVILPFWFFPVTYLMRIPGIAGQIAAYSYLTYIATLIVFHVSYSFVGIGIKECDALNDKFERIITAIAGYSMLLFLIFTGAMVYLGLTSTLNMSWYHYFTLPAFTIIFFRIIAKILKSVPYIAAVSGTLAMLTFFIGFVNMISRNITVFM